MGVYIPYKRLPSAYQEVEYIQSSGTQYFVVGTSFKTSYKSVIDFQMTQTGGDQVIIGFYFAPYRYGINAYANNFKVITGSTSGWSNTISENTNRHTIIIDKSTATVDGNNYTISGYTNVTVNGGIGVFAHNDEGVGNYFASVKIYNLEIYDENGALIYHLVPCYRKNDSVIGMYDLVNNQFYTNSGTGTFSKGNDVTISELKNAYIGEYVWNMDKWALAQTSSALSSTWRGGVFLNNDGSKIFLTCAIDGRIYECALSTPYDISSLSFNKYISLSNVEDIHFSNDGRYLFALQNVSSNRIYRYTLSTAWDISTATQDQSISTTESRSLFLTEDGKSVYAGRHTSTYNIRKWSLSTAWNLSTAGSVSTITTSYGGLSLWFSPNGKMFFYQLNESTSNLSYAYLSTPYDLSSITSSGNKVVGVCRAGGIWFNHDGTMCFIVGGGASTNYVTKYTL